MDSRTVKKTDFCMLFGVIHVTLVCLFAGGMTTYILFVLTTSEPERVYEHLPYVLQISSMVVLAIVPPISYSILKQRRALHLANEKLEFLVRIDQLTGLLSRGTFFEEVEGILENSDKENVCNAIAFLDIDHFKKINDRHGHAAGDDVLRQLGRVFGDVLQPNEIAGRIGGEEFAIFIPDCTNKQAWQKIQRLVDVFKKEAITVSGITHNCTLSAGVAVSSTERDLDRFLNEADQLLYLAKNSGRNNIQVKVDCAIAA